MDLSVLADLRDLTDYDWWKAEHPILGHLLFSFLFTQAGYWFVAVPAMALSLIGIRPNSWYQPRVLSGLRWLQIAGGLILGITVSVGKEIYDIGRGPEGFSRADLRVDAIGIALALAVCLLAAYLRLRWERREQRRQKTITRPIHV